MTFLLAPGWTKIQFGKDFAAYYNCDTRVFSTGPVVDVPTFLTIAVSRYSSHLR